MKSLLGWFGERKTGFHLWLGLDSETYFRYPDVILESKTGTVQIDHIVISPYGVFIVETKNLSGCESFPLNSYVQNHKRATLEENEKIPACLPAGRHGISRPTFYSWRSKYSGMQPNQLKRLKELESELSQYKRMYAELAHANHVLKEVLEPACRRQGLNVEG